MVRRNVLLDALASSDGSSLSRSAQAAAGRVRPLAHLDLPREPGVISAVSKSLEALTARSERVEVLERQIASSELVLEIDPALIDPSFASDRMAAFDPNGVDADFVAAIREEGQLVPALLRRSPSAPERYQPAYGRRRIAAAAFLGRKVRAVVRNLSDEDLVVAQGQENEARNGLTFIEKCRFAATLEAQGFTRKVIERALKVDKTLLSRMLHVAVAIPAVAIDWIGPAEDVGRPRWFAFAEMFKSPTLAGKAERLVAEMMLTAVNLRSSERFAKVVEGLSVRRGDRKPLPWTRPGAKKSFGTLSVTPDKITLTIDRKTFPALADLAIQDLEALRLKLAATPLSDPSTNKKG